MGSYRPISQFVPDVIQTHGVARKSYSRLVGGGISAQRLENLVRHVVFSSPLPERYPAWYSGSGMTLKGIRSLARRARRMASEIKRLNSYPLLCVGSWLDAEQASARDKSRIAADVERLPSLLRFYADFLDGATNRLGRTFSRSRPSPRSEALLCLMREVREATGRPMYAALSNVLTAVAIAAGAKGLDLDALSPDSLKTLDSTHREK